MQRSHSFLGGSGSAGTVDRSPIVARHLLEGRTRFRKAAQLGLLQANPLHGAQPAPVERLAQVIQE